MAYYKKVRLFGYWVCEHGKGGFGKIYSGITGQDAVNFLLCVKSGEIRNAFQHPALGFIDLVYGEMGKTGFGLAHILEKHPEIISNLHRFVINSKIVSQLPDRTILLYEPDIKSIISLTWHEVDKKWLVTTYQRIFSAI
ncbi:MAG: hypothetical protein A3C15_02825 [Candidatus Magasanikbacteria bacterium RIFCSPHIGHO2_02_FULL_50_9b]|uniref:Phage-Barnase-EndoU-ColicinE5/D-RelE-like nuclease domain-containing protein n=1 Tax=Candidatus Magasanikbacteria bacterium RIFCSPHIGHO2_02_FULL_50_9b TaxID=1798682 RepID=A0A1F6M846_9BACT|nr:MAG: hypothetical protein A3C15_02825 [Candidatus Magasanikbacteria bacterium RIFCSPHIGHO2_02_FULL_50_9b]